MSSHQDRRYGESSNKILTPLITQESSLIMQVISQSLGWWWKNWRGWNGIMTSGQYSLALLCLWQVELIWWGGWCHSHPRASTFASNRYSSKTTCQIFFELYTTMKNIMVPSSTGWFSFFVLRIKILMIFFELQIFKLWKPTPPRNFIRFFCNFK